MHVVETVCKGFEDYAQAKYKSSGEPTIIRLMTHEGNMSPLMSQVDMIPDEDLNTKLKFYVSIKTVVQWGSVYSEDVQTVQCTVLYTAHRSAVHVATRSDTTLTDCTLRPTPTLSSRPIYSVRTKWKTWRTSSSPCSLRRERTGT